MTTILLLLLFGRCDESTVCSVCNALCVLCACVWVQQCAWHKTEYFVLSFCLFPLCSLCAPSLFLSLYHSPFRSTVVLVTLFAICTKLFRFCVSLFVKNGCFCELVPYYYCLFASLESVRVVFSLVSFAFALAWSVWVCVCAPIVLYKIQT